MPILEICANSFQSAFAAQAGGAHRIELCQNLEAGGTTPSYGLIQKVKQNVSIPVHVLIRPRTGDFVYDHDELDIMLNDIRVCRELGCDGIVVGVLTPNGSVDLQLLNILVRAAKPLPVTFHRAFDECRDLRQALEDIVAAGCERILTSGGRDSAVEGRDVIANLVALARGRVVIMPGAGITAGNIGGLVSVTGAREYHASAKAVVRKKSSNSRFDAVQLQTDTGQVRAMVDVLTDLSSNVT